METRQWLMIRNPGVADHRGFTLLGVSTTRTANQAGTIGQFGSGSKLSIALLLRHGIEPVICCGSLRLSFFTKNELVGGNLFRRVCVKYQGTDADGRSMGKTEDLGFTLEWGVADWTKPSMAFREFVSNAIDGSLCVGQNHTSVRFDVVDKPRAQAGMTSVYLPMCPQVEEMYKSLNLQFLHFGERWQGLTQTCLPKTDTNKDKVLFYKKGVLVSYLEGKSCFDYNLDNLKLDESRNATEWDVKYEVAKALRKESPTNLTQILRAVHADPNCFEARLDTDYVSVSRYASDEERSQQQTVWQTAWKAAVGEKAVACESAALVSYVAHKGYDPVVLPSGWKKALGSYGVPTEDLVLTKDELAGKTVGAATPEMVEAVRKVWTLFESLNVTNGKKAPGVKSFNSIMDAGSQVWGYFRPGEQDVYLHAHLGGKQLFKMALEECTHYLTGADDNSRDIQNFLFGLLTDLAS